MSPGMTSRVTSSTRSGALRTTSSPRRVAARDAALPLDDLLGALRSPVLHAWQPPAGGSAGALNHAVIHSLDVTVALDGTTAPQAVSSLVVLAKQGFFDGSKCHRLTTNGIYVLQCGDPTGSGSGGPGYTIPDENLKDKSLKANTYPAGTVAMANTGQAHTGGSQFFLVYQDSQLPPSYTPFGTISESGMKVLKKIAAAGESTGAGDGAPNATVVINKATVTKS